MWDAPKWAERHMRSIGNPDMDFANLGIGAFAGQPDTIGSLYMSYCKGAPFSSYYVDEVRDLVLQAKGTLDDNERGELIKKVFRYIRNDYAFVPFWTACRVFGMKDNIDFTETLLNAWTEQILVKDMVIK